MMIVQISGMSIPITRGSLEAIRDICDWDGWFNNASCTSCIFFDENNPYCPVAEELCNKHPCFWDNDTITEILEDME